LDAFVKLIFHLWLLMLRYLRMNPAVLSEDRILQQLQARSPPPRHAVKVIHSAPLFAGR
jgi:hypothetical protein